MWERTFTIEASQTSAPGHAADVHDSLYFRDPDGIQIELTSQPLRGMPE
jgi:hypothetical protein